MDLKRPRHSKALESDSGTIEVCKGLRGAIIRAIQSNKEELHSVGDTGAQRQTTRIIVGQVWGQGRSVLGLQSKVAIYC